MDKLHRQVARARWRLTLGRLVTALSWCWLAALAVATIAVAVIKIWPLPVDGPVWTAAWLGGSLLVGFVAAVVWTWLKRDDPLKAALEIDGRFGLKERISSTLAMRPEELDTPAGRALLDDALRRAERIDVGSKFKVPLSRKNLLPLAPTAAVIALMFVADKPPAPVASASTSPTITQQPPQVADALRRKIADRRKEATEKGLKDASDLFKKIEEGLKDLTAKDSADKKQALVKLNDLAKQLDERRSKLGGDEKLKQQLNQMKDLKDGPADKLTTALKKGDFQKALKELDKLQQQLASDKIDQAEKQKLAEQLDAVRQNLEKMAEKHDHMQQQLKQQMQQLASAGKNMDPEKLKQQMDKLQQQLDKLGQQGPQMDQLKKLAQQCQQGAQALKDGNSAQADKAMSQLAEQLSQLKKQSDETRMLDSASDMLADAKDKMTGAGDDPSSKGRGGSEPSEEMSGGMGDSEQLDGPPGNGLGKGKGTGPRPEAKTDTKFYDSNVKQKLGQGAAIASGPTEGPNIKGQVQAGIKAQVESASHEAADPLTGQRLPRSQREHAKEYFDALREGK